MKHLLAIALLCILAAGCARRPVYGGSSMRSCGNPDRQTTTCVATQLDPRRRLLFVIAWTAGRGGGTTTSDDRNLLTSIHGHPVQVSADRKAVYALQADYTLSQIQLSEADLNALFAEMQTETFHTSHSDLWQKQVAPKLTLVEVAAGGR